MPPIPRGPLATYKFLLAGILVVIAGAVAVRAGPGPSAPLPKDFAQYYVAGKLALRGELGALYFTDLHRGLTESSFPESRFMQVAAESGITETSYFIYPPWVGLAYAPLALLPPHLAFAVAYAFNWVCLLVALGLLASALPGEGFLAAALTAAPLIVSPPVVAAMTSAQASVPLFLLLVLFARALGRGRAGEAGLWWGVMTALKLFPLLFVFYLVAKRRWRTIAWGAAVGVALAAVGVVAAGADTTLRFARLVVDHMPYSTPMEANQSVTAFALRWIGAGSPFGWSIVTVPAGVAWASRVFLLASLGLTLWLVRRRKDEWLQVSLFSLWVFAVAPNAWLHHLVALGLPFAAAAAVLLARGDRPRLADCGLWLLAWALVFGHFAFQRLAGPSWDHAPWSVLASLPLLGSIVLYALVARLLGSQREAS